MKNILLLLAACVTTWLHLHAQVPPVIEYSGRVVLDGTNVTSTPAAPGFFKCILLTKNGSEATIWSSDGNPGNVVGTSRPTINQGEPSGSVELTAQSEAAPFAVNGQFKLRLGDSAITQPLSPGILADASGNVRSEVYMRVWFSADNNSFQRLEPDVKLASAPYAIWSGMAETVKDRAITSTKLADGSVTVTKLLDSSITEAKLTDGSVTAAKLAYDTNSLSQVSGGHISVSGSNLVVTANELRVNSTIVSGGALVAGNTAIPQPGAIRWTGSDFEGYNGIYWASLTRPLRNPPPEMVWIGPGTFTMGSPTNEPARAFDEGPQTTVTISRGFWMGKHEVTQQEYLDVMGSNPSFFTGDLNRPVEQVSWNDATNYCARLTAREWSAGRIPFGYAYRLPTEAEWEYACRAATTTAFHHGNGLRSGIANFDGRYEYPPCGTDTFYCYNSSGVYLGRTTTVGSYAANLWGLYDMHGNVWEWCLDWYANSYPGGSVTDPTGPATGSYRVDRGGGWGSNAVNCRSANRDSDSPTVRNYFIGFRCVLPSGQP